MENKLEFSFSIHKQIYSLLGYIDGFKGRWSAVERENNIFLKELRRIATIQSIGSSTRIEGSTMTNEEVEELLNNLKITKLKTRDEQEIAGYFEVLEMLLDSAADIEISESNIKSLHNLLLKHSAKDKRHKGNYKQHSNQVVATYPTGEQKIIFRTTSPLQTPIEMENLVKWTNEQIETKDLHPLLTTAVFVYEFLSIHPFQDGNGRLSRLLTSLLLLREGYDFIQYISFERIIEEQKSEYYRALMDGQRNRYTDEELIDKWVLFFLNCLKKIIQNLDYQYESYVKRGIRLNSRQEEVLAYLKENAPLGISDLDAAFPQFKRGTLRTDLKFFVQQKLVMKAGRGRATAYLPIKVN